VDKESYLLELSRYVRLNPWRLKRFQDPFAYRWSSLGAYVGRVTSPKWFTVMEVLSYFGSKGKSGYKEFISDGMKGSLKTPWEEVRGQVVIGCEKFAEEITKQHFPSRKVRLGERSNL